MWGKVSTVGENCHSHDKITSPKQFELKQSRKALIAPNNRCGTLPFYHNFEDEKSNGSNEKSVKRKDA